MRLYFSQTRFVCENICGTFNSREGRLQASKQRWLRLKAGQRYMSGDCEGVGTFTPVEALLGDSITFEDRA
jgi:hypothetical protein